MARELTTKHWKFIAALQTGASGVQAAVDAGYPKRSAKHAAYQLTHENKLVMAELERLRALIREECELDVRTAMANLSGDIIEAKEKGAYTAVPKLRELQMKLFGLLRDKLEVSVEKKIDIRGILDEANARAERYFAGTRPICDPANTVEGTFEALPSIAAARPIDGDSTDPAKWQPFGIDS